MILDFTIFAGVFIGFFLLIKVAFIDVGIKFFFNLPSLLIVLGGVIGASLIHFPITQCLKTFARLKVAFSLKSHDYIKDINLLLDIATKAKKKDRKEVYKIIDKVDDHFLKNAIHLYLDRMPIYQLELMLRENIEAISNRHEQGILFFEQMAKYAPSFGLLGTLIGLINLLANMQSPDMIGPNMSLALVTTFYGVLFANLVFKPLAGRLRMLSFEEIIQEEMMLKVIISMANGDSKSFIKEI